jgi:hypothetical protein
LVGWAEIMSRQQVPAGKFGRQKLPVCGNLCRETGNSCPAGEKKKRRVQWTAPPFFHCPRRFFVVRIS